MRKFEPSEVEIIRTAIRARQADIRTAVPALIESYDAAKQTCTCQLAVRLLTADGVPEEVQPLTDVPVKWQRGGGYFCSMPLAKGDPGLLVFCESDFSSWRATGEVSDPAQERRHGLYAYFLPGGCADGDELASAAPDALVIGKDGGPTMTIDAAGLKLGASASDFVALASLVSDELNKIATTLGTGSNGAGAVVFATPYSPGDVAATKVKAE